MEYAVFTHHRSSCAHPPPRFLKNNNRAALDSMIAIDEIAARRTGSFSQMLFAPTAELRVLNRSRSRLLAMSLCAKKDTNLSR